MIFLILVAGSIVLVNSRKKFSLKTTNQVLVKTSKSKPVTIFLQPFSGFPIQKTIFLNTRLKDIYSNIILLYTIELPHTAYYLPRNRYRADSLIRFLSGKVTGNDIIAGITSKDISTTKGTNPDSGIFGLGYQPGPSCVISNFRLRNSTDEQLLKVLVHELGHTQGLQHCPIKSCFMKDAEGEILLTRRKNFVRIARSF